MRLPYYPGLQPDEPLFTPEDYAVFAEDKVISERYDADRQRVRDKFLALHTVLWPALRERGWDLHPHWRPANIVSAWHTGWVRQIWFMKLRYLRSHADVKLVHKKMKIPDPLEGTETQYTKHPMLDVRIDRDYFTVELLVTEWAWWDGQNFKRKLERHSAERQRFVKILQALGHDYVFGGWPDSHQPQLITTAAGLADEARLMDWLASYQPGESWLRVGIWYTDPLDYRLTNGRIVDEVLHRFDQLYPVYEFILWGADNDHR